MRDIHATCDIRARCTRHHGNQSEVQWELHDGSRAHVQTPQTPALHTRAAVATGAFAARTASGSSKQSEGLVLPGAATKLGGHSLHSVRPGVSPYVLGGHGTRFAACDGGADSKAEESYWGGVEAL